jgi:hypothetical protein
MLISGLCLWSAPYIAYQLSVGRVYEGVSQTISSWVGQLAGAAIGYYSASVGASIARQADTLQANAQQEAEGIRAAATAESGERFARAAKILGQTQTNANAAYQTAMASAGAKYQIATAGAQLEFMTGLRPISDPLVAALLPDIMRFMTGRTPKGPPEPLPGMRVPVTRTTPGLINTDLFQKRNEVAISATQDQANLNIQRTTATSNGLIGMLGGTVALAGGGEGAAGIINSGGSILTSNLQWGYQTDALTASTLARFKLYGADGEFQRAVERAHLLNYARLETAANDNKTGSIKASDDFKQAVNGGYSSAYRLSLQGNEINRKGAIEAASVVRNASVEAARLRSIATVVNSVGNSLQKGMDGLTLRY